MEWEEMVAWQAHVRFNSIMRSLTKQDETYDYHTRKYGVEQFIRLYNRLKVQ